MNYQSQIMRISELINFMSANSGNLKGYARFLTTNTFIDYSAFATYLMNLEDDGCLQLQDSFGQTKEQMESWKRVPMTSDVPGIDAIKKKKIVWLANIEEWNDSFNDTNHYAGSTKLGTIINVPLNFEGSAIGILGIMCSDNLVHSDSDESFLTAIAGLIALSIKNFGVENNKKNEKDENKEFFLTRRQRRILQLISEGLTNNQIAHELGFSLSTVRHETMRIYKVLNASGRREAIITAIQNDLITAIK